jgi:hypothetical protein
MGGNLCVYLYPGTQVCHFCTDSPAHLLLGRGATQPLLIFALMVSCKGEEADALVSTE